ncbi:MAG: DUF116 domain-containing protein [Archaeoglobaceae archaeon]
MDIRRLISAGIDLGTRSAVKAALKLLGEDERQADIVFIAVKNVLNRKDWRKTDISRRAIFLPHCLRDPEKCKAKLGEYGYTCERCGSCPIGEIVDFAESLGYDKVYVVPGGSMVMRILSKIDVDAVLGVACVPELCEALERIRIPAQAVPLSKAGCFRTDVDIEKVKRVLSDEEGAGNSP